MNFPETTRLDRLRIARRVNGEIWKHHKIWMICCLAELSRVCILGGKPILVLRQGA
jgi:hypothetical protein